MTPTLARGSLAALFIAVLLLAGCAQPRAGMVYDPLEPANRKVFVFNETVDDYVLEPAADAYVAVTTEPMRQGVTNFFNNLSAPGVFLNDLLQGKLVHATRDLIRFGINSTLGLAGLLDPASRMGLPQRNEDFGQTLGVWGSEPGPFLMLPLFGPSNTRDVTRYPVGYFTNVLTYVVIDALTLGGLTALNAVNTRASLDRVLAIRDEAAVDPYSFTRSSYHQLRRSLIYDGNPPVREDLYDESFFEEMETE